MFARLASAALLVTGLANPAAAGSRQAEWVVVPADAKLYMRPEMSALLGESRYGGGANLRFRKLRELPSGWAEVETVCDSENESERLCDYN